MISKKCSCGRVHDMNAWLALPCIGRMDDGNGFVLVLRNCPCKSTLAVPASWEQSRAGAA